MQGCYKIYCDKRYCLIILLKLKTLSITLKSFGSEFHTAMAEYMKDFLKYSVLHLGRTRLPLMDCLVLKSWTEETSINVSLKSQKTDYEYIYE